MNGKIELIGMEFHAYHGCLDFEKTEGNSFVVDFTGTLDMSAAIKSDKLEDTLDYSELYEIIKTEMSIHSDLLEHVAGRLVTAIAAAFPQLYSFSVSVAKKQPPVSGPAAMSRITLSHVNAQS